MDIELNVISGGRASADRLPILMKELSDQGIVQYKIWPGIHDVTSICKSINLSHKQIVADAKERELPFVIIAEDDIQFTHPNSYQYFLSQMPHHADYDLFLAGIYLGTLLSDNSVKSFSGLQLYSVSCLFYDTFLSTPDDEHLDRSLSGKGRFFVCNPFAAIQYNGFSHNTGKEENYTPLLHGRKLYEG